MRWMWVWALAACGGGPAQQEPAAPAPQVAPSKVDASSSKDKLAIVIVLDASAAPYFGMYGDTHGTSPNLDALAKDAVVFDHAMSASATTGASTGSFLTSTPVAVHTPEHGAVLSSDLTTVGEALTAQGVATWAVLANPNAGGAGRGYERGYHQVVRAYKGKGFDDAGAAFPLPDDVLTPLTARVDADGPGPTMIYAHFLQPHSPYSAPANLISRFGADPGKPWPDLMASITAANTAGKADPALIAEAEARYRANIAWIDEALGRFFAHLKERGLYDEALIVVTSDHGEAFFHHKKFGHILTLYDDMTHVPLLIKPPESQHVAPGRISTPVETIDVPATVVSYFGVPLPASFQGDDLGPLYRKEIAALPHPEVVASTGNLVIHALRQGDLKLIVRGAVSELYDLAADPDEQTNLAASRPEVVAAMRTALQAKINLQRRTDIKAEAGHAEAPAETKMLQTLGYTGE